jgi:hypothetical protein
MSGAPGDGGSEHGVALTGAEHGLSELFRRQVLEQEPARACPQGQVDVLIQVEGREDDDPGGREAGIGEDKAGRLDAVQIGHADVHEDDIRDEPLCERDGLGSAAGLADDLDAGLTLKDEPESSPDHEIVSPSELENYNIADTS